jgi:hypothetical protein
MQMLDLLSYFKMSYSLFFGFAYSKFTQQYI